LLSEVPMVSVPHRPLAAAFCASLTVVLLLVAGLGCNGSGTPDGYQGIVEFDEQLVASEVPGRVSEVLVRRGTLVRDQQELVKLDDTLAKLAYEARKQVEASARAELALLQAGARTEDVEATAAAVRGMRAQMSYARRAARQARALGQQGSIANSAVDRANVELASASAEHRSLERKLAALRIGSRPEELAAAQARVSSLVLETSFEEEKVQRHTLRAKGVGMVVDVSVEVGELAAVGTPAVTVADVAHPYADVFVPQGELDGIRLGSKATLRVDGIEDSFPGSVEYVSPKTEFTPRFLFSEQERPHMVVRVRVRVEDPKLRLHAGLPAFVQIAR
jgi:HlyD family secretion protein